MMASSDDEADTLPESVSTYHFVDDKDELISFSMLPIRWSELKSSFDQGSKQHMIFLKGSVDNGLRTIYKQVIAWKFDLSNTAAPQISVLAKDKCWMVLEKPRKSYEIIIQTVLITLHCLHFAKWNPEASCKSVWDYLSKTFSVYEHRPSQNDLVDHMDLIGEAVQRENSLAKCKFLLNFLLEKPRKKLLCDEDVQAATISAFIVDDVEDENFEDLEEDESNDEDELFDSVCAFCDNGGSLLCCEGSCLRSFHATEKDATEEAGEDSACESLGFTNREVEAMQSFFCKNCKFKQHQCFACGKLGCSDKFSGAKVFRCANATCGHFYHPLCVASLLHRKDKVAAEELRKKIAAGESFACPIHKCSTCKQVENKKEKDLQFAVCRRCPTSYHRKCLPKEIIFEIEADEDTIARAWEDLLPNRILIYCLKHDIIEDIGTPIRDHVRFPDVGEKKTATDVHKRRQTSELPANEEEGLSKKRRLTSEESFSGTSLTKASKEMSQAAKRVKITNQSEKISSESNSLGKMRTNGSFRKSLKENTKSASTEVGRSTTANGNRISLGDRLYALMTDKSREAKHRKQGISGSKLDKSLTVKPVAKKLTSDLPPLDADTKRRVLALVKEAVSSITLEDVIKKHEVPSTHSHSSKNVVDKNITLGKVEGTVEAVRTALKKLEENCSIEDAKAVCEPGVLNQVFKWKNKLKVYLAPFLYGMRYTSFGRHFTKVDKLMKIADILHWYVENGDMIVDFCCGANDFSCLVKKKLEEMGKKCSYKNYDFIQPKNDYNFEKRDWMTVHPDELPKKGSQLIMGLNPPFGVKAALANKFIDKALQFKPKLLILIVPPETERLDKKKTPYDLVWKDDHFLSGKSFYLPGSVDENDKQMDQWNLTPPPLYLWSRREWSVKHKAIAQKHGHPFQQQERSNLEKNHFKIDTPDPVDDRYSNAGVSMLTDDIPLQSNRPEESNCVIVNDDHKGRSRCNNGDGERQDSRGPGKSHSNETSWKKRQGEKKVERGKGEKSLEGRQNGGKKPSVSDSYKRVHHPSPPNIDGRSSLEGSSRSVENRSHIDIGDNFYQHLDPSLSGSYTQQHGTPYGGNWASIHDDMSRRHDTNSHEPYSHEIHGLSSGGNMEGQSMTYATELDRESDRQSQVRFNGQDADSVQWNYPSGSDLGYGHMGPASAVPYGHLGLAAEQSHMMNMSAMQRYAPRLDELNHTRMSNLGPEPSLLNRNGIYDPR